MKKTIKLLVLSAFAVSLLTVSCGPSKKLQLSMSKVEELRSDSSITHSQLIDCNTQVKNLKGQKTLLESDYTSMQNENTLALNDLKEIAKVSNTTIANQAKRLKTLSDIIQSQKDIMLKLKNSIADALMKYKSDELYVYNKDGNVYVALEEKLLFKSGSDIVDPKGKEALKSLAAVLNNTPDINVVIEGHTDDVPILTTQYKDNWDLSVARATTIVRLLTVDYKFDATRITASGKGMFHPVKTNETVDGRAGNRRTEIILSPNLSEIYKLLYQD
jgi:chemotaxis protein MotB